MRAYFRTMHEITGRSDFLYFATARKEGAAPTERNFAMKEAGIYVMRTGWEQNDSYFHLHGVQLERGERSTHSHNDQGHFELHIKGEDVLIDSGRYIYNSSCWKNWRKYFLSACAHNTLYVDDHDMGTVPGVSRVRGVRTFCHRFEETDSYSVIDISHNGYVFMEDPIYHRRRVIRLEGDVYILDDQITGLGRAEHDIRLYFNFAPGELKQTEGSKFIYTTEKNTSFNVISVIDNNSQAVILKGSEEPIGGWVSYGYPVRSAIPQLYFKNNGPVPLRFITVIAPSGTDCTGSGDMKNAVLNISGKVNCKVALNGEEISVIK
jgi:hypothetical protein